MSLTAATHRQAEAGLALHDEFGLFLIFLFQLSSFLFETVPVPRCFLYSVQVLTAIISL